MVSGWLGGWCGWVGEVGEDDLVCVTCTNYILVHSSRLFDL